VLIRGVDNISKFVTPIQTNATMPPSCCTSRKPASQPPDSIKNHNLKLSDPFLPFRPSNYWPPDRLYCIELRGSFSLTKLAIHLKSSIYSSFVGGTEGVANLEDNRLDWYAVAVMLVTSIVIFSFAFSFYLVLLDTNLFPIMGVARFIFAVGFCTTMSVVLLLVWQKALMRWSLQSSGDKD